MKKVVSRKLYDTETATELATVSQGSARDFRAFREGLYKTAKGAYFLAGEGGPMTHYAKVCFDGGRTGGSDIFPLTINEALDWCETNRCADLMTDIDPTAVQEA